MKFIKRENITALESSCEHYMSKIDIDKNSTRKLVKSIATNGKDKELLDTLNTLEQNIESIDSKAYSYCHLGNELSFSELSRGEKVFLVSFASKVTGQDIYLQHDMMQLTKTALRKYYTLFKDCDNIHIVYESESDYDYLVFAMQGRIK